MTRLAAAQAAGVAVTVIAVLGRDPDLVFAAPLGLLAAALTLLFAEIPNVRFHCLLFARARR
ncbi:MAG: hypothetical protein ACT4OG_07140 [Alphaproteobacteria bacterium]